jgi:hypothetical protein
LADHVAVAAVAGCGVERDAAAVRELLEGLDHRRERRHVVAVIDNHCGPVDLQQVEAARQSLHVGAKRLQARADRLARQAHAPGGADGGEHVFDLEGDPAAVRQRHTRERHQRHLALAFAEDDFAIANRHRAAPFCDMFGHHRIA